jgi:putative phosphoesterase
MPAGAPMDQTGGGRTSLSDTVEAASRCWRVGVVSDTHGLVRPELLEALEGSDLIVHAGDVGKPQVLEALARVAPVHAVLGNTDCGLSNRGIPEARAVEVGEVTFWVLHDLMELDLDPAAAGFAAVISGHLHEPSMEERQGVLYLNPGSAGPRRHLSVPVSLARIEARGRKLRAELVELAV